MFLPPPFLIVVFFQKHHHIYEDAIGEKAVFKLAKHLLQTAQNSCLDNSALRTYLKNIKLQYNNVNSSSTEQEE